MYVILSIRGGWLSKRVHLGDWVHVLSIYVYGCLVHEKRLKDGIEHKVR